MGSCEDVWSLQNSSEKGNEVTPLYQTVCISQKNPGARQLKTLVGDIHRGALTEAIRRQTKPIVRRKDTYYRDQATPWLEQKTKTTFAKRRDTRPHYPAQAYRRRQALSKNLLR